MKMEALQVLLDLPAAPALGKKMEVVFLALALPVLPALPLLDT
jgi:hypothetical protein